MHLLAFKDVLQFSLDTARQIDAPRLQPDDHRFAEIVVYLDQLVTQSPDGDIEL
jgi:hypothetical protein